MRAAQSEDSGLEREAERSAKDNELKVSTPASVEETPWEEGHPHGNLPKRARRRPHGRQATPMGTCQKGPGGEDEVKHN